MKTNQIDETSVGTDGICILRYLENFPDDFITEMEIARRADGRVHFLQDPHWAHIALPQLLEAGLLEGDGLGKYRKKGDRVKTDGAAKKYLSPQLRSVLERSQRQFDLSDYD